MPTGMPGELLYSTQAQDRKNLLLLMVPASNPLVTRL